MASNGDVVSRWFQEVTKPNPRFIGTRHSNTVFPGTTIGTPRLYSWGSHFTLVELITCRQGDFFLVNGDTYSHSTSEHQSYVRSAANRSNLPVIILPFSALHSAGIDHKSIVPTFIEKDRIDKVPHESRLLTDMPTYYQRRYNRDTESYDETEPDVDGVYRWTTDEHFLGASGFRATWSNASTGYKNQIGYFLSAFDDGEPGRSYFLCQLPRKATSYEQALQLLKPPEVIRAEDFELPVVRQGDIFAIPVGDLAPFPKGTKVGKMARLLGTSHVATQVVETAGKTYARGIMWHKPTGRWDSRPEHVRKVLGDRNTWYLIVQNTVPKDRTTGEPRGWQITGRVD